MVVAVAAAAAVVASSGCAALLEDYLLEETPRVLSPSERLPEETTVEISNYGELKEEIMGLIMKHEGQGRMLVYTYDGDITMDVAKARREIMYEDPVGSYAVSEIAGTATRIVTYSEVEVKITYKRTKQQVESIVNIGTDRSLLGAILRVLLDCEEEAVFRTSQQFAESTILVAVRDLYYKNPRGVVMMPVTGVGIFPRYGGSESIYELKFGYPEQASIMLYYKTNLLSFVGNNARLASGETDGEILLSLAENLIEVCSFNVNTARSMSVHGAQNLAVTAYGALVNGRATGEGFAMAYKALCDELMFDCSVVLGRLDGMVHAWNIVALQGDYYHVDVAMGDLNGIETAFLKTDEDFMERYTWDMDNTVECNGTLTYEDIVPPEGPEGFEGLEGDWDGEAPSDSEDGDGGDDGDEGDEGDEGGEPEIPEDGAE